MSDIKVSIILAVYNVEPYIRQALDSLVNQTLKDIEIICVDDCSTDGSLDIIQEYAQKDNRFVVLKQESNQGPGVARNRALDVAKGEYIMFLDPDDWYELDACEIAYNQISHNKNSMVLFAHNKFYEETNELIYRPQMIKPFKEVINQPNINLDNLKNYFMSACFTWAFVYNKNFLNKYQIRYAVTHAYEDHLFLVRAFLYSETLSIIQKALYNYRVRQNSLTNTCGTKITDLYPVKLQIVEELKFSQNNGNKKKTIFAHTIRNGYYWLNRFFKDYPKDLHKAFYNTVRKVCKLLDTEYVETTVKDYLTKKEYKFYKQILKYNYLQYKIAENFKFNSCRDILHLNYTFISYLTAWIFPTKSDRKKYRKICKDIDERRYITQAQRRYPKLVEKLRNKKGKIRILFLVNENSKWKAQSLYDLMAKDDRFEPIIALSIADIQKNYKKEQKQEILEQNKKFFENKGTSLAVAYDTKLDKPINIKKFSPDVVFYQQPCSLYKIQDSKSVSKYALTYYIPYYVNDNQDYNKLFYKYLYRHYVLNLEFEAEYERLSKRKNIRDLGYTMLDNNKDNRLKALEESDLSNNDITKNLFKAIEKDIFGIKTHQKLDQ